MKKQAEDYHAEAAQTAMFAVFNDFTVIRAGRKKKSVEEGSIIQIKAVEMVKPGMLKLTPMKGEPGFVKAIDVRIYTGRVPDWRLELFLVEHGYQAETYRGVQCTSIRCRDFGGNHPILNLQERLDRLSEGWLSMFKRRL